MTKSTFYLSILILLLYPVELISQMLDSTTFEISLKKIVQLKDSSKTDLAIESGNKLLKLINSDNNLNALFLAKTKLELSNCYHNKSAYEDALPLLLQAYDHTINLKNRPYLQQNILTQIGFTYYMKGNLPKSKKYFQDALHLFDELTTIDSCRLNETIRHLSTVSAGEGDFRGALVLLDKALKLDIECFGENHVNVGMDYFKISGVKGLSGQYSEAIEFASKSLKIFQDSLAPLDPRISSAISRLGSIHLIMKDNFSAIKYLEKALDFRLKKMDSENVKIGDIYNNLGIAHWRYGARSKALDYYFKATDIYLKKLGPNHIYLVDSYMNIGISNTTLHNFKEAFLYLDKALTIGLYNFKKDHPTIAKIYTNIGHAHLINKTYEKARIYFEKALTIYVNRFGKDYYKNVLLNTNIGDTYYKSKRYQLAKRYYHQALEICKRNPDQMTEKARVYLSLAKIAIKTKDYAHVPYWLNKQIEILNYDVLKPQKIDDVLDLYEINQFYTQKGKYLKQQYKETNNNNYLDSLEIHYSNSLLWIETVIRKFQYDGEKQLLRSELYPFYENALFTIYHQSNSNQWTQQSFNKALAIAEKSKATILIENLNSFQNLQFSNIPKNIIAEEIELKANISQLSKTLNKKKRGDSTNKDSLINEIKLEIVELKEAHDKLITNAEINYPAYFNLKYNRSTITSQGIQKMLNQDQALIEYFVGDSTIYALIVSKEELNVKEIILDFPLHNTVNNLRKGLYDYWIADNKTDFLYHQSNQLYVNSAVLLYQKLIAPFKNLPQKLIIIPDGVLGYIPFEVLLKREPKDFNTFKTHDYLGKDHIINYNYSASLWQEMQEKKVNGKGLLAFAPQFKKEQGPIAEVRSFRKNNLGALTHNISEVKQINRIIGGKMFLNENATADNFLKNASKYSLLHLATHAKLDDQDNDFSYLAFTNTPDTTDSEKIYISDLYNMNLPLNMVVLSACETGIGELQRGEGIISLSRGFTYAGAKSIITSLWEVNDKAASEIMTEFYAQLKSGASKETALYQAKIKYLDDQIEDHAAHPFFWATFIAMGDMSPISIGYPIWLKMLIIILLISLFFIFLKRHQSTN